MILFKSMLTTSLKDKISLFYSTLFPIGLLIGLGFYIDSPNYVPLLLTGVIGISTVFWGVQGQAFQVHAQRTKGVYKLLKMTPISTLSFVFVMTIARTLLGTIINLITLVIGAIVFDISLNIQQWILCTSMIVLGTLCFTCLGFFISNLAKNEGQINMYANLLYLPMVFGSTAFYKLDSAPQWLVSLGNALPFQHMINSFRFALNFQDGPLLKSFFIVFGFTLAFLLLAAYTFRWEADSFSSSQRKLSKRSVSKAS